MVGEGHDLLAHPVDVARRLEELSSDHRLGGGQWLDRLAGDLVDVPLAAARVLHGGQSLPHLDRLLFERLLDLGLGEVTSQRTPVSGRLGVDRLGLGHGGKGGAGIELGHGLLGVGLLGGDDPAHTGLGELRQVAVVVLEHSTVGEIGAEGQQFLVDSLVLDLGGRHDRRGARPAAGRR